MKLTIILKILKSRKRRFIACFCSIVLVLSVVRFTTSCFETVHHAEAASVPADSIPADTAAKPTRKTPLISYRNTFDDLNDVQLEAAQRNGLSKPIRNREEAEKMVQQGGLVFVGVSPFYYMDDLTHSIPYLVPKAHRLLNRIGVNYIDSLTNRGVPLHILMITSVLRTEDDINHLQRRNGNASSQSCHRYGTTFDISYSRYKELGHDPQGNSHDAARQILMKRTLGEVLRDLRDEGRCYVKHEVKQGCFHVTVR